MLHEPKGLTNQSFLTSPFDCVSILSGHANSQAGLVQFISHGKQEQTLVSCPLPGGIDRVKILLAAYSFRVWKFELFHRETLPPADVVEMFMLLAVLLRPALNRQDCLVLVPQESVGQDVSDLDMVF
ncbi:hypothetical protein Pan241w_38980 [Gimesia alba]|uniref:Uncharacterized protein n=1 Tax=Gimesia alba TaxID=2527973 RepID=A0A517RIU5_9PLAN|nr:hypothetical protein Pan241w_38980 [Gimesia alba]